MQRMDYRDLIAGLLLVVLGLFFALYGHANYPLGELRRMGPGFFPIALGYVLAALGLLIVLPALRPTADALDRFAFRPFFTVLVAIAAFAVAVPRFGMIPATILLTLISAFAEFRFVVVRTLLLAIALSLMAVLIFTYGLGVPIPAVRWDL